MLEENPSLFLKSSKVIQQNICESKKLTWITLSSAKILDHIVLASELGELIYAQFGSWTQAVGWLFYFPQHN